MQATSSFVLITIKISVYGHNNQSSDLIRSCIEIEGGQTKTKATLHYVRAAGHYVQVIVCRYLFSLTPFFPASRPTKRVNRSISLSHISVLLSDDLTSALLSLEEMEQSTRASDAVKQQIRC